jgi:hypothetical protein
MKFKPNATSDRWFSCDTGKAIGTRKTAFMSEKKGSHP